MSRRVTSDAYPRVLIVNGEPIGNASATGLTLANLFHGWPGDGISQIYTARVSPNHLVCARNWRLSNSDLLPLMWRRLHAVGRHQLPLPSQHEVVRVNWQEHVRRKIKSLAGPLVAPVFDLFPYRVSAEMRQAIAEFDPELIYSNLGNIRISRLVRELSMSLAVPVVPHFFDDWFTTYSSPGHAIGTCGQARLLRSITKDIVQRAPIALAIGDAMAEEYERHFGVSFLAFMSPVPKSRDWHDDRRQRIDGSGGVRLVYVGGLHLGRDESLLDVARVVSFLRNEGLFVELVVYAPVAEIEKLTSIVRGLKGISLCGAIPQKDIQRVLGACDIGVHVESFAISNARYTRLSVSTKIPQYFAAGLPVLAYGPASAASARYVIDNNCGVAVGSRRHTDLAAAVKRLVRSADDRRQMGQAGQQTAARRHDEQTERGKFVEVLRNAARSRVANAEY